MLTILADSIFEFVLYEGVVEIYWKNIKLLIKNKFHVSAITRHGVLGVIGALKSLVPIIMIYLPTRNSGLEHYSLIVPFSAEKGNDEMALPFRGEGIELLLCGKIVSTVTLVTACEEHDRSILVIISEVDIFSNLTSHNKFRRI